jgi:hypothetical protein
MYVFKHQVTLRKIAKYSVDIREMFENQKIRVLEQL